MKILFISHEYPPVGGGGSNACVNLAEQFANKGHIVHVLTVQFAGTDPAETTHKGRLTVYRVPAKRAYATHSSFLEMLDYLFKANRKAKDLCGRENYDACLCFFGLPGGVLAQHLKQTYGIPYILRMGGGDIPGGQDRFRLLYKVLSPRLRRIWKHAGGLVANSEGLRQNALKFCSQYKISVIPNGVDTDLFCPPETVLETASDDTVRLLTVCRLIEKKGLQDVIPNLNRIEQQTKKIIRWTIAGDGPYRGQLETLARQNAAGDRISFLGNQAKDRLPEIYRHADIFIFPSHHEGMPNAVLEAMSSGLPVIMRKDCQGAEELIRGNGIAAEGDFGEALTKLIAMDSAAWRQMGMRSREWTLETFTWKHTAEKYETMIENLVRKTDQ